MVFSNAQSQASPKGRNQKNSQHEPFRDKSSSTRSIGDNHENQSFRGSGNDSEGRNVLCWTGGSSAGGTIKQLIAETLEELQDSESKSDKLRRRLVLLSNLLESVDSPSEASEPE